MARAPFFELHLGVLRKHWLLILFIAALVAGGGYYYLSRQVPIFEAKAKLRIIRQAARSSTSEVSFSFEDDQVFYSTQYNLLQTQLEWAEMALDRAAYRVIDELDLDWREDPGGAGRKAAEILGESLDGIELTKLGGPISRGYYRDELEPLEGERDELLGRAVALVRSEVVSGLWGFTPDSLLGRVRAAPIPGTYLAELTLSAGDIGVAVFLVNLYAELYRDVSTAERRESLTEAIRRIADRSQDKEKTLREAETALESYRKGNPDLAVGDPVNNFRGEADAIAARINSLETEQLLRSVTEERIRGVLDGRGIGVVRPEDGPITLRYPEGAEFYEGLAKDLEVLDLDIVAGSESVALLRGRVQGLEAERFRMPSDLTDEAPRVKRWQSLYDSALRDLGKQAEKAILDFFEQDRDTDRGILELKARQKNKDDQARDLNDRYVGLHRLTERVLALRTEKEALSRDLETLSRLSGEDVSSPGPVTIQNIRIERRARLADARQTHPNYMLIVVLTGFAALLLSLGAAYLIEFIDDTIKTKADFERFVAVPDIGYIPRIGIKDFKHTDSAVLEKPHSGVAEAFRSVRTGILFSKRDEEIRTLLLTSAGPGEGKTTVAVNLSHIMAQAGRGKVLLIDADLRKARVHTALGVDNSVGLTNCLIGNTTLEETVRKTKHDNLYVLPSGPTPPNPAELLGGHRMAEILEEATKEFGKIIIDTPPLVAVTDTSLLAPLVDGVFLVISAGKTSFRLIQRGKDVLNAVGVTTTGAILNNIRSRHSGYGYGYGYGYGGYKKAYGNDDES